MNTFKKISVLILSIFSLVAMGLGAPLVTVQAADTTAVCEGVNLGAGGTCDDGGGVVKLAKTIINILSWIVGVISVIMIVIAGLSFVLSGGDSAKITKARSTITYAIVGIVVVALAQVIVRFVLGSL